MWLWNDLVLFLACAFVVVGLSSLIHRVSKSLPGEQSAQLPASPEVSTAHRADFIALSHHKHCLQRAINRRNVLVIVLKLIYGGEAASIRRSHFEMRLRRAVKRGDRLSALSNSSYLCSMEGVRDKQQVAGLILRLLRLEMDDDQQRGRVVIGHYLVSRGSEHSELAVLRAQQACWNALAKDCCELGVDNTTLAFAPRLSPASDLANFAVHFQFFPIWQSFAPNSQCFVVDTMVEMDPQPCRLNKFIERCDGALWLAMAERWLRRLEQQCYMLCQHSGRQRYRIWLKIPAPWLADARCRSMMVCRLASIDAVQIQIVVADNSDDAITAMCSQFAPLNLCIDSQVQTPISHSNKNYQQVLHQGSGRNDLTVLHALDRYYKGLNRQLIVSMGGAAMSTSSLAWVDERYGINTIEASHYNSTATCLPLA